MNYILFHRGLVVSFQLLLLGVFGAQKVRQLRQALGSVSSAKPYCQLRFTSFGSEATFTCEGDLAAASCKGGKPKGFR